MRYIYMADIDPFCVNQLLGVSHLCRQSIVNFWGIWTSSSIVKKGSMFDSIHFDNFHGIDYLLISLSVSMLALKW